MMTSKHVVKACDIHIGINKPKLLFIIHSSKTHGEGQKPQLIKITVSKFLQNNLCLFKILNAYLHERKWYCNQKEQFFVFSDRPPVKATHFRRVVKDLLIRVMGYIHQPVGVPRICRRFSKFTYTDVCVCGGGNVYSLRVWGWSRRRH